MKSFFDKAKKRLSTGGKKSDVTSSFTSTTTTTTTRYENGVPVEVITKTYTNEPDSPIENEEPFLIKNEEPFNEEPFLIKNEDPFNKEPFLIKNEDPFNKEPFLIENEEPTKGHVEKPVAAKPVKKTEECDHDEPVLDDSTVGFEGERSDPASRCSPVVDLDEFKNHLDLTDRDFTKVDNHAINTPKSETGNSSQLSKYLTKPWNDDIDKLRCIFVWIAENIRYDTDAYFGGHISHCGPDDVLKTRKSVCEGYAGLFDKMASEAGLKVWKITGKSKGAGFTPGCDIDSSQFDHAWNGVLHKGEFLLVDNTWGAGYLNGMDFEKRLEPFHFLCSPTQFIYSHLPDKPEHQYVEPNLTKEEFLDLPFVKPKFFTSGLRFVKHLGNTIEVSDDKVTMEIERINPDESKPLHAKLEWGSKRLPVMIQRLSTPGPKGGRKYKISCTCPSKGEGKLNIFVMLEGNSGPLVSTFTIKNSGSGKSFAPYVDHFSVPFSCTIHNPIHAKLNFKENVKFEITIFDLPESELPSLALFLPEQSIRDLQKVSSGEDSYTFVIETCVDQKGKWALTYCTEPNSFQFIAQYTVE